MAPEGADPARRPRHHGHPPRAGHRDRLLRPARFPARSVPAAGRRRGIARRFATVGIGPGLSPSTDSSLSIATKQGLADAATAGPERVQKDVQSLYAADFDKHAGYLLGGFGRYGTDYVSARSSPRSASAPWYRSRRGSRSRRGTRRRGGRLSGYAPGLTR